MTEYLEREIAAEIIEALESMPVVVITGMRQTGKTTFLQKQPKLSGRYYVSFDDFSQLGAAKLDPDGFVSSQDSITIDEVHKCPEVLTAIKRAVDRKRIPGQFLLSGSANLAVLKGISESLAGRAVYFTMHPFSRREVAGRIGEKPFVRLFFENQSIPGTMDFSPVKADDVLTGGMPVVALGQIKKRSLWFKGYEQTYLERDIRDISQIGNMTAFRNLLRLAVLRTGQLLNPSGLGRDAKMSVSTTSRYLSLLEASFITYRLEPYLRNRASRLIKSPKIYVSDSGLGAHLAGLTSLDFSRDNPMSGALLETYVAQNLFSIVNSTWPEAHLFFWCVQGRHEVDFVIEAGSQCIAVEIKSGARWGDGDLSGLKAFLNATPNCTAAILSHNGPRAIRLGEKIWAIPLSLLLS
ncbi:MAG: ATP-binding protein [Pseudomonadota bacterium]